jgi:hypothetical protein
LATSSYKKHYIRDLLLAVVLFLFAGFKVSYGQEIKVSTDKQEYSPGEKIIITVLNNSSRSVFSTAASSTPDFAISNLERKLSRWSWDAFRLHCSWPECDIDFDAPGEIRPGQSKNFRWEPRIYLKRKYAVPEPGLYRLTMIYQIRKDHDLKNWTWKTVKSNEFLLK